MISEELEIAVSLAGDDEGKAELATSLLHEVRVFDIESACLSQEIAPPHGSKALEGVVSGVVTLVLAPPLIVKIMAFLQEWFLRDQKRVLKITRKSKGRSTTIEISGSKIDNQATEKLLRNIDRAR